MGIHFRLIFPNDTPGKHQKKTWFSVVCKGIELNLKCVTAENRENKGKIAVSILARF